MQNTNYQQQFILKLPKLAVQKKTPLKKCHNLNYNLINLWKILTTNWVFYLWVLHPNITVKQHVFTL